MHMVRWLRVGGLPGSGTAFGTLEGDDVVLHDGELFGDSTPTGDRVALAAVTVLPPCRPTKIVALWNNLRSAADRNGWAEPAEPLYFIKPSTCVVGHGEAVRRPASYDGRI